MNLPKKIVKLINHLKKINLNPFLLVHLVLEIQEIKEIKVLVEMLEQKKKLLKVQKLL